MFGVGKKVKFYARVRQGVGVIVGKTDGLKGHFWEVKPEDGSKNIKLRESQLSAA